VRSVIQKLETFEPSPQLWTRWQESQHDLAHRDLLGLRRALLASSTPGDEKDRQLAALVRLAQRRIGGNSASTAVLVCLLPGLSRAARRYQDITGESDGWSELLCATMRLVAAYDLDRRPRRIAANLIWDATAQLLRTVRSERSWRDRVHLTIALEAAARSHIAEPDVLEVAVDAGVLAPVDAVLIRATRLDGLRLCEAAMLCGLSYEAAKKRRRRAEVAWATWWAPERAHRCGRGRRAGGPRMP
jgi:hypothetical protein